MDAGVPLRLYYQLQDGHAADAEVIGQQNKQESSGSPN
jgi:hypothetical protein